MYLLQRVSKAECEQAMHYSIFCYVVKVLLPVKYQITQDADYLCMACS